MRIFVALTVALLTLPLASSSGAETRDALVVSLHDLDEHRLLITWSAGPGAIAYEVYAGSSPDDLHLLGETSTTTWFDVSVTTGDTWYVILSKPADGTPTFNFGTYRGACVNHRGTTGVSVTAAHCVPAR